MRPLEKERFEALIAYTRNPLAAGVLSKEVEWYASDNEVLLATIIIDFDNEFTSIILAKNADFKYYCIDSSMPLEQINDARKYMLAESKKLLKKGKSIFPHGNENNKTQNLFDVICDKEKLNPHFEKIRTSAEYSSAREIITEIMPHFKDVDGNFIKDFQTTGFDSRLWELYLFAYLTEERLFLNREHEAPDFLILNGSQKVAIEAVTVNASQNNDAEIEVEKLTPEKIQELLRDYMPLKYGSPLFSKLNRKDKKKYWEMEHTKGCPLVFAIADFHAEGSMCWSSTALSHYLYGMRHEWHVSYDGQLIINPIKTDFTKKNGAKITGFFSSKDSENVSAVLFSAAGTISKFVRMGKIAGFGDTSVSVKYGGVCHNHSGLLLPSKFFFEVDSKYKESWGAGISIFHNPNALHPLPEELFPSVAHHYMLEDGKIICLPPKFHPYSGLTFMHPITDDITQESFDSLLTYFSTGTGKTIDWSE
jgi:hypothetical protein